MGDSDAQRARTTDEAQRRIEGLGLAVATHVQRRGGLDVERGRGPRTRGPVGRRLPSAEDDHPEVACVEPRAPAAGRRALGRVGVVGHQDHRRIGVLAPEVVDDAQRRCRRTRAPDLPRRFEQDARLRAPIFGTLHGVAVEPETDVVDEDAAVDLAEVDAPLHAVGERGERADRIARRDPEVAREVIARSGRDADEWQVLAARRGSDDGHRAVPAGHAQRIGAAGDRITHESREIPPGLQNDTTDAQSACLLAQPDAGRRATSRGQVDEQDRTLRHDADQLP